MGKILVIVGPTATGKTKLGVELARKFGGEVASADARQIYKYLDIGTGKDLPPDSRFTIQEKKYNIGYYKIKGVRVWLYDVIEPNQRFSAVEYAKLARKVIGNIWKRGKLPILVGGTGFYIKAVLEGIETSGVPADWKLREKLQKLGILELQAKLKSLNKKRLEGMNRSDRRNPRRLVRAIEIARKIQMTKSKIQKNGIKFKAKNMLKIGLIAKNESLYGRIDKRVNKRMKDGIVEEIKMLLERGYSWEDPGFNALGYKEFKDYFNNGVKLDKAVQKWKYDEHSYVRRQLTWFKGEKNINWFSIDRKDYRKRVEECVKKWYHKK